MNNNLGLKGEFDDGDIKVEFLDYENVMTSRLLKRDKSMIERAENEFLLYKADEFDEAINVSYKKYHKYGKKVSDKKKINGE